MKRKTPVLLIVHGGAGKKRPGKRALKKLSESLSAGYALLSQRGTALDAVIEAIAILEDSGIFNAGAGGNPQLDGVRRLDASLMEGRDLKTGSVIGLEGIRNPVRVARIIMDSPHVLFTNTGARRIADIANLPPLPEPDKRSLKRLDKIKKGVIDDFYQEYFSTVGAVALDMHGDVAAGSSTGGIRAMLPGRVGDTPIIGAGVYADNAYGCASCTGRGEDIIRLSLAKEICMNLRDMTPHRAARMSLGRLSRIKADAGEGEAGVIVLKNNGQFTIMHTTAYMASGYISEKGIVVEEGFRRV